MLLLTAPLPPDCCCCFFSLAAAILGRSRVLCCSTAVEAIGTALSLLPLALEASEVRAVSKLLPLPASRTTIVSGFCCPVDGVLSWPAAGQSVCFAAPVCGEQVLVLLSGLLLTTCLPVSTCGSGLSASQYSSHEPISNSVPADGSAVRTAGRRYTLHDV